MEKGATLKSKGKEDSFKGKDDSSMKSKYGRKVHINFEGSLEPKTLSSPKYLGKDGTPFPKGYSSKGGKGDKIANGGKTPAKEPQPLELNIELELPENVKCMSMMDCEAASILQGIQDQMVTLSKDPELKLPVPFDKGLQYAKRGVHYTNPLSVRKVLETLTKHGVSNSELCEIANVGPESVDEVFSLVPSLKIDGNIPSTKTDPYFHPRPKSANLMLAISITAKAKRSKLSEPLKGVLSELAKLKESASLASQLEEESQHGGKSTQGGKFT